MFPAEQLHHWNFFQKTRKQLDGHCKFNRFWHHRAHVAILWRRYHDFTHFFADGDSLDILQLTYLSQVQFVSEDCGEKFVLSRLRVGEHSFDSVRLVVDVPTQAGNTINIEIFQ